jgi:hypothetical protein
VKRSVLALAIAVIGFGGCNGAASGAAEAGQIDVRWTGSERGRLTGRAGAEWCSRLRLLEIRGIKGDTGIALAIYSLDTLTPGEYPVTNPVRAESLPPAAGIALRWAAQTAIKGFQGESGLVALERARSGKLSGRVTATARSVSDTGVLDVSGTFQGLAVRTPTRGCAPPAADTLDAPSGDTLVH